jgi:hypothetical protein
MNSTVAYAGREDEDALAFTGVPVLECEDAVPGFYLADDADGRFVIDHETGVISVFNEALITREFGAVYMVRLRVVERDGGAYEFAIRLKITGVVPQTAGEDEASLSIAVPHMIDSSQVDEDGGPSPFSARAWTLYAAARAEPGRWREPAPRRPLTLPALLPTAAPCQAALTLEDAATHAFLSWSA